MNSNTKKISASLSYLAAIACFFLPFMEITCSQVNMTFEVSGYALATGTAGEEATKQLGEIGPGVGSAMPMGSASKEEQSIGLLVAMLLLACAFILGLKSSSGPVKGAIGLGALAAGLMVFSIPSVKPGMEEMIQVSLGIGFYGILVCSILGVILHVMRLKDSS